MNFSTASIDELKSNLSVDRVYAGKVTSPVNLYPVYDNHNKIEVLEMEVGDDVLVTIEHDGTWRINFMSIYPNTYHYSVVGMGSMADNDYVHIELPLKEL